MANLGEIAELINSKKVRLDVGSDTYIAVQDIFLHAGRTESRDVSTDGNPFYSYGAGDNWFTAKLFATTPEFDTLNAKLLIEDTGEMPITAWKIVYTDRATTSKTFACTGTLSNFEVTKAAKGGVYIDIFVRITGDIIA